MRGSKAKALRREARKRSVAGKPERLLLVRMVKKNFRGKTYELPVAFNDPTTTRGIYRNLKRGMK